MKQISCIALLLFALLSCEEDSKKTLHPFGTADLNKSNRKLLEVVMEDGFSPPVASRVYTYPHIAHYIALRQFYPDSLPTLTEKLNGLAAFTGTDGSGAQPELTALLAFCKTAQKLVFSEHYMIKLANDFIDEAKSRGISNAAIEASKKFSDEISKHVINWLIKDQYIETRTMDRFTSSKKPGEWRETPPDYIAGLESHWMKMRTMLIDSAGVYKASDPPVYNADKNSDFYKMVLEVYNEFKTHDSVHAGIAWFWDDNPNVSEHRGHLITMTHKISPPGHWLNIIDQVSTRDSSNLFKTTKAYTYSAIAMYDGIISCWYEKYKTNLVRPVSYIQEYIDVNWKPLIQTPPFPEWTSGHSVLSAAAATVLTHIYGENYPFVDSTEVIFDQPARHFESFHQAAWEVSLSRFYAGIHYKKSIEEGNKQGKFIGIRVIEKLK